MRIKPAVVITAAVVIGGMCFSSYAESMRRGSIAVTDFTMKGEEALVDTWATGLADYMSGEMAEAGIDVLERRDIRYVLSERMLQDKGLLKKDEIIRQRLPWVQYLLKGELEKIDEETVKINVSVADFSSAQVAFQFSVQGAYPDDLSALIRELVQNVAQKVGRSKPSSFIHSNIFGFTKIPEVAIPFYRGMDHYMQGRVAVAEEYFRNAFISDRKFLLAAVWRMKCYEDLDLPDLAAWFKRRIMTYSGGKQILDMYDVNQIRDKNKIIVTPVLSNEPQYRQEGLFPILQDQLLGHPDVQIFQPDWIRGISSEIDLSISPEFGFHQLREQPWLTIDALVTIGAVSEGDRYRVRLQLVDAVSGNIIAEEEQISNQDLWKATVKDLLQNLLASDRKGSFASRPFHKKFPIDYKPEDLDLSQGGYFSGEYSLLKYAYVLRLFSENQDDRALLSGHYKMHETHSHQRYHHLNTYDNEWGYLRILWDRFYKLIDKDAQDAAHWISYYLWEQYQEDYYDLFDNNGMYNWNYFTARKVPMEQAFSILLNDYPDSFPTIWVRYNIGLEKVSLKRYAQAAPILVDVVKRLEESGQEMNNDPLEVNVYFYTAYALKHIGKKQQAKRYLQRAREIVERAVKSSNVHSPTMTYAIMFSTWNAERSDGEITFNVSRADYQLFHWKFRRFLEKNSSPLNDQIANLDRELRGLSREKTLADFYQDFKKIRGDAGVQVCLNYIGKLTVDMKNRKPLQHDFYLANLKEVITWVAENGNANDLDMLHQYVGRFILAHKEDRSTYYFQEYMVFDTYMAAKMINEATRMADEYFKKSNPREKYSGIGMKAQIFEAKEVSKEKIAHFLCREREQFYKDFEPAPMRTYFGLALQCAGALREMKQYGKALSIYQSVLGESLEGEYSDHDFDEFKQYQASFKFHKAYALELNNDKHGASTLFRELVELTEEKGWQPYLDNGDAGGDKIYDRSLRRLEGIRKNVFKKEEEIRAPKIKVQILM